jgi:hypothetical protein
MLSMISSTRRVGVEAAEGEGGADVVDDAGGVQLAHGQVDGDGERAAGELRPGGGLHAGALEDPPAQGDDEAGFLGQRYELEGRDQAERGVGPTHEGFEAAQVPRRQVHVGLVLEAELAVVQPGPQVLGQRQAAHGL